MANIHDLKAAREKAIGHENGNRTIYILLARHGWRKPMPVRFIPSAASRLGTLLKKRLSTCGAKSQARSPVGDHVRQ